MSGWVDRLNRAILRGVSKRPAVQVTASELQAGGHTYRFSELRRAVAFRQASWVGDELAVALEFDEGVVVVLTEQDAGWSQLLVILDADPRTQLLSAEWSLRLVGGDAETRLELLRP